MGFFSGNTAISPDLISEEKKEVQQTTRQLSEAQKSKIDALVKELEDEIKRWGFLMTPTKIAKKEEKIHLLNALKESKDTSATLKNARREKAAATKKGTRTDTLLKEFEESQRFFHLESKTSLSDEQLAKINALIVKINRTSGRSHMGITTIYALTRLKIEAQNTTDVTEAVRKVRDEFKNEKKVIQGTLLEDLLNEIAQSPEGTSYRSPGGK